MSPATLERVSAKRRSFVVRVRGGSLAHRAILDGDYLVVQQHPPMPGDTVVVRESEARVDVRAYDPAEGAEVLGVVLALVRKPREGDSDA